MSEIISIGIDIGGTKANIGLVKSDGTILKSIRIPVQAQLNPEQIIIDICGHINTLIQSNRMNLVDVSFWGVGVPGTADINTGIVEYCPNLKWEDVPAGEIFKKHLGRDVVISQDARLAAWAEYLLGAGKNYKSIFCITVGTGIGGGIIIDGKIFHGGMNTAGEMGHTTLVKNGRECNCGRKGCLERYTSGRGIIDRALELFPEKFTGLPQKSETVFQLVYAGDHELRAFIETVIEDLAIGIANVVAIISPEAVIISGGLCNHDELIIKPLREKVYQLGFRSWTRKHLLKIEKAQMGSDAPMIGAALLYKAL